MGATAKRIGRGYVEICVDGQSVYVPVEAALALSQDLRRIAEEEARGEHEHLRAGGTGAQSTDGSEDITWRRR